MSGAEFPTVTFVGAGPGAADLLTFRGARAIAAADTVIWAASLVHPDVLAHTAPDATVHDSSRMTLEDVCDVYAAAADASRLVARVQSGDPFVYGAINEQIDFLVTAGIPYEIVPGVTSVGAAAAALGRELTVPEVTQSVVLTRIAGRTPMPPGDDMASWAARGSTMAVLNTAAHPHRLHDDRL